MVNPLSQELEIFKCEWDAAWLDDDLDRRRQRLDELIAWKARICEQDERPIVDALCEQGFNGNSVWDLVNTQARYPELIETLCEHLNGNYLPVIKEGIVRALMVREGGDEVRQALLDQWQIAPITEVGGQDLKWALAYVISYRTRRKQIGELAALMDGNEHTDDPFVRRLKRSEEGRAQLFARLEELAT